MFFRDSTRGFRSAGLRKNRVEIQKSLPFEPATETHGPFSISAARLPAGVHSGHRGGDRLYRLLRAAVIRCGPGALLRTDGEKF